MDFGTSFTILRWAGNTADISSKPYRQGDRKRQSHDLPVYYAGIQR